MRRMLDPTKVGGIPSTIEFDKDGNRKVSKNLGVDGKLTLKSLVSESNPDGDITKELGGKLYCHHIALNLANNTISGYLIIDYYRKNSNQLNTTKEFISDFNGKYLICSGYVNDNNERCIPMNVYSAAGDLYVGYVNSSNLSKSATINNWFFDDKVYEVK